MDMRNGKMKKILLTVAAVMLAAAMTAAETPVTVMSSIYSWNPASYTYHFMTDGVASYKLYEQLAAYTPVKDAVREAAPVAQLGFLATFTDGTKESYYITETQLYCTERGVLNATPQQCKALYDLAKANNAQGPARAQWLRYMSAPRLTEVSFSGLNTKTLEDISFTTTDPRMMTDMAHILQSLTVKPESVQRMEGEVNFNMPAGLMTLKLTFDSGVVYDVYITDDWLDVLSSDMSYSLGYRLTDQSVGEKVRMQAQSISDKMMNCGTSGEGFY